MQLFPLHVVLALGGVPLVALLLLKTAARVRLRPAGRHLDRHGMLLRIPGRRLVVLMLSGGEALEAYAVRSASSVPAGAGPAHALRRRTAATAATSPTSPLDEVAVGDKLVGLPARDLPGRRHVVEGHGMMDESYLTGEPYMMSKAPGSAVLSGAINGETALTIRADAAARSTRATPRSCR